MTEQADDDALVERFRRHYLAEPRDPAAERRTLAALARPRTPAAPRWTVGLAAAALLVLAGRFGWPAGTEATPAAAPLVPVRFVLATDAERVSVVGDFNGWDPEATPMARVRNAKLWEVDADLEVGRTEYAFVLDGHTWIPDPNAPLAPASEFGASNSVLTVRPSGDL